MSKKWTWDQVEKSRKRRTESVSICIDNDAVSEHERLERELVDAREEDRVNRGRLDYTPRAPQVAQRIVDVEALMDEATVEFVFAEVGQRRWSELLKSHPPTKEQRAEGARNFNPETFPVAAMAASCVQPEGATEEHFQRAFDEWGGQFNLLWTTCMEANVGVSGGKARSRLASEVLSSIGTGSEEQSA